jgi:hypothetical protein
VHQPVPNQFFVSPSSKIQKLAKIAYTHESLSSTKGSVLRSFG